MSEDHGIDAPVRQQRVTGYDGTQIAYYVSGSGPETLVMAPGLGTPFITWKYLIEDFQDQYTIVTWDPRGTYDSAIPSHPDHLLLEDHVRDMVSVCEDAGLGRFHLGGWSMGVQICLEYYHQFPEKPACLMLIGGAYQHVLSTAFDIPGVHGTLKRILCAARTLSPAIGPLATLTLRSRRFIELLGAVGMVTNNRTHFARMAHQLSDTDWKTYLTLIQLLDLHSAAEYLPGIQVPTLVVAGDMDRLTPLSVARRMYEAIPESELFIVRRGTHYLIVEYPEIVNVVLRKFLGSV